MELRKISAREEEESMIEMITNVNSAVNNVVWGWPALILLGFTGVLMTSMTGFFQLSHLGLWLKNTIGSIFSDRNITRHTEDRSISQFQSLCTALAATVGTGNIGTDKFTIYLNRSSLVETSIDWVAIGIL